MRFCSSKWSWSSFIYTVLPSAAAPGPLSNSRPHRGPAVNVFALNSRKCGRFRLQTLQYIPGFGPFFPGTSIFWNNITIFLHSSARPLERQERTALFLSLSFSFSLPRRRRRRRSSVISLSLALPVSPQQSEICQPSFFFPFFFGVIIIYWSLTLAAYLAAE